VHPASAHHLSIGIAGCGAHIVTCAPLYIRTLVTGRSAMQALPAHAACMRSEQHSPAICPTLNRCSLPLFNSRSNAAVPRQHELATRRSRKQRRGCSTQGQAATRFTLTRNVHREAREDRGLYVTRQVRCMF
jgi:hypothetical protein